MGATFSASHYRDEGGFSASRYHYEEVKNRVLEKLLDGSAQKIFVEAWNGVGATALPQEVAEAVESGKREFDIVIKVVGPTLFRNPREMQRAVAKQLNLPSRATAALDEADKDNDFSGVEFSSRNTVSEVTKEIYRAVNGRSVLLVLCNNLVDAKLIDPKDLGIPIGTWYRNAILWTSRRNITTKEADSLIKTDIIGISPRNEADAVYLVWKEADEIARYINESSGGRLRATPQLVLRCFQYCLLLCRAFNQSVLLNDRPLEAVKYFVCDEILQGDSAWEIGKALALVIGPLVKNQMRYWQEKIFSTWTSREVSETLRIDSIKEGKWEKSPSSSKEESYCWISVYSPKNDILEPWDFFKIYRSSALSNVSSFFWHFEETHRALPDGFFDHFSNIRVLDLLRCIVSPINSSFLRLRNLRMLRLEQCKVTSLDPNSHSSAREGRREPILFDNLWVLNLYNSDANTFLLAGKAFELMPNLLELDLKEKTSPVHLVAPNELGEHMHKLQVLKLSGNISTNFLPRRLSMAISLKELILINCMGLVSLNFNLPATIETIKLQSCASLKEVELVGPAAAPLPNLKTFHLRDSKQITKLFLQGCRKLENVDLQELIGLEELNLSCTAIKVVVITKLSQLKKLFLLGCEQLHGVVCYKELPSLDVLYLDNYDSGRACDVDHCLDSFRNQRLPDFTEGTNDANQRSFQAHVVVRDVRLFRSLYYAFPDLSEEKFCFHIHIKGYSDIDRGINIGTTTTRSNATITSALCYADFLNTMTDHYCRHHPSPPTMPLNNHIEVDGGHDSPIINEYQFSNIMGFANSLFVHDNTSNFSMDFKFKFLKCFRIERCPNLKFILSLWPVLDSLESIWLSQLPRLKALNRSEGIVIWKLKHIYLEFCVRLEYVFSTLWELHNLETINIHYCNDLTAILNSDKYERGADPKLLPKLRSIHLQELPKLQRIYKANICAPSLEELKFRGCLNLRKLPLFGRSDARSLRAVKISCEKDWWDKLQWDGLESNHHSSLFNPEHCPYYKKPMKARWL